MDENIINPNSDNKKEYEGELSVAHDEPGLSAEPTDSNETVANDYDDQKSESGVSSLGNNQSSQTPYNQPQFNRAGGSVDGFISRPQPAANRYQPIRSPQNMATNNPPQPSSNNYYPPNNPPTQSVDQSFAPVQPAPGPKKSKKILVFTIFVLLLAIAGGVGAYFYLNNSNESNENTLVSLDQSQKPSKKENYKDVLAKLDNKYIENNVTEEVAKHFQATNKEAYQPYVYVSFDDSKDYSSIQADEFRRYQFSADKFIEPGKEPNCEKFMQAFKPNLDFVDSVFKDANYKFQEKVFHSQYNNCGKGRILTSEQDRCSVETQIDSDMTGKLKATPNGSVERIASITVACIGDDNKKIEPQLKKLQQIRQIMLEVDPGWDKDKPNGSLVFEPEYIKESKTPGYMIAKIEEPVATRYFYKKLDDKWHEVSKTSPSLECSIVQKDKDLKLAFLGEECFDAASKSSKAIE